MKYLLISLCCCLSISWLVAQSGPLSGSFESTSGLSLPYKLWIPASAQTGKKAPLVLFLHGAGERGADNEKQLKHVHLLLSGSWKKGKPEALIVAPQCPNGLYWSAGEKQPKEDYTLPETPPKPIHAVQELVDWMVREYRVDDTRIYIIGISMGGNGGLDILTRYPGQYAAGVIICGWGDPGKMESLAQTPLWLFHGARDNVVPPDFARRMADLRSKDSKDNFRYTEYADCEHSAWDYALKDPELIRWLFRRKNKK